MILLCHRFDNKGRRRKRGNLPKKKIISRATHNHKPTKFHEDNSNTIYQTKTNPELKSNRRIPENQKSNKNCITKKREKENPNQCKMKMRKTPYIKLKQTHN